MPSCLFPLAFGNFSGLELLLVLAILLLLFGGSKLPALARGLGQSIKEFKKASREDDEETKQGGAKPGEPKPPQAPPSAGAN